MKIFYAIIIKNKKILFFVLSSYLGAKMKRFVLVNREL